MAERPEQELSIAVEVAYAVPGRQTVVALRLPAGSSVATAVAASGLASRFPETDLTRQRTGIFGVLKKPHAVLADGDRVEVYRPLNVDPKQARRLRAEAGKTAPRRGKN